MRNNLQAAQSLANRLKQTCVIFDCNWQDGQFWPNQFCLAKHFKQQSYHSNIQYVKPKKVKRND